MMKLPSLTDLMSLSKAAPFARAATLVTGAAHGIGRNFSLALAAQRATVVLVDIDHAALEDTAAAVRAAGGNPVILPCDVTDAEAMTRLGEDCLQRVGPLDLAVLNAGLLVTGEACGSNVAAAQRMMAVNFWGVVHGDQVLLPPMLERGRGRVLHVASLAGWVAAPNMGAYAASKAAVIAWSESLHAEVAHRGVSVTVCCPSFTKTELIAHGDNADPKVRRLGEQLMDRLGA